MCCLPRVQWLDLHSRGPVEASTSTTDTGTADTSIPDATGTTDTAIPDATSTADTTEATTTTTTAPAEVATEAFPAGTAAPWHALQRHVPC